MSVVENVEGNESVKLSSKARERVAGMVNELNVFLQGVRLAYNVPDDWDFDQKASVFMKPKVPGAVDLAGATGATGAIAPAPEKQ